MQTGSPRWSICSVCRCHWPCVFRCKSACLSDFSMMLGTFKIPFSVPALRLSLSRWAAANNHNSSKTKCGARLASEKISSEKHTEHQCRLFSLVFFFFLFFCSPPISQFGICFSDACGSLGDVSDLSLGRGAVSGQTAHQGEWQVLGRELAIHFFLPRGEKLHTVA